jgi:CRP-like cAMP-binding protein
MRTIEIQNKLLQELSEVEQYSILRHSKVVELESGQILSKEGEDCGYVYFPLSGFISSLTSLQQNQRLEVGMIGNEGMLGVLCCLGINMSPVLAIVQGKGKALQIDTELFETELRRCVKLQQVLQHYLAFCMVQLNRLICCNHFHETEPRLARWLLMAQDRTGDDSFCLSHQGLAANLGVTRSSLTEAAALLLGKKSIDYNTGQIQILDRPALERTCCSCYREILAKQQYFLTEQAC